MRSSKARWAARPDRWHGAPQQVWGETHVTTLIMPVPFKLSLAGAPTTAESRRLRSAWQHSLH